MTYHHSTASENDVVSLFGSLLISTMANSDGDAILSVSILRGISDKMYEKRKWAALEVEQVMKELAESGARDKVKALLEQLVNDYAQSEQANRRKVIKPPLPLILTVITGWPSVFGCCHCCIAAFL